MSFSDTLKEAKKAVVMGALTAAAVVAPVKGQSAEAEPTAKDTITATVPADVAKKQMFRDAVRRGAPKEEIAKYMDFPEFIPVTKHGQLDKAAIDEVSRDMFPYIMAITQQKNGMTVEEVHKTFVETTGRKDIPLKDFEAAAKLAEKCQREQEKDQSDLSSMKYAGYLAAGLLLLAGGDRLKALLTGKDSEVPIQGPIAYTVAAVSAIALLSAV